MSKRRDGHVSRALGAPLDFSDPKRVEILQGSGTGYWKKGQYGYVKAMTTRGGMYFCNKEGSVSSKVGEPAFLVSKSKDGRGGALWFSADGIRFTEKSRPRPASGTSKETSVLPPSVRVARAGLESMREHGIKNLRYGLYRHAGDRSYEWGNFTGTPERVITSIVPNDENTASQAALVRALKWKGR